MTVHELILKLEQLDRFTEVVIHIPNELDNKEKGLYLTPIVNVEEIETDNKEKFILLEPMYLHGTNEISSN